MYTNKLKVFYVLMLRYLIYCKMMITIALANSFISHIVTISFLWQEHLRSLVAQMVRNLPAMWETWVGSLGWEDPWRREWLPIPVFLPGEFHGQKSLVSYSPWGPKESDTTE